MRALDFAFRMTTSMGNLCFQERWNCLDLIFFSFYFAVSSKGRYYLASCARESTEYKRRALLKEGVSSLEHLDSHYVLYVIMQTF